MSEVGASAETPRRAPASAEDSLILVPGHGCWLLTGSGRVLGSLQSGPLHVVSLLRVVWASSLHGGSWVSRENIMRDSRVETPPAF